MRTFHTFTSHIPNAFLYAFRTLQGRQRRTRTRC
jgi:hypothetical protein